MEKIAASVLLKLFINGSEKCLSIERMSRILFLNVNVSMYTYKGRLVNSITSISKKKNWCVQLQPRFACHVRTEKVTLRIE